VPLLSSGQPRGGPRVRIRTVIALATGQERGNTKGTKKREEHKGLLARFARLICLSVVLVPALWPPGTARTARAPGQASWFAFFRGYFVKRRNIWAPV
jgi:hypothetical protein